jgi:UV radiation resistance-associated gene protein
MFTQTTEEKREFRPPSSLRSFPSSLSDLDVSSSQQAVATTVTDAKEAVTAEDLAPSSSSLTITTEIYNELPAESPESGSTTPTITSTTPTAASVATADMRRSRLTLGLSPLAGFLKARYPSAVRSLSASASNHDNKAAEHAAVAHQLQETRHENGEGQATATNEGEDDEDDRRTITAISARGLPDDEVEGEEGKGKVVAEDANDSESVTAREKGYPDKTEHSDSITPATMLISSPTI